MGYIAISTGLKDFLTTQFVPTKIKEVFTRPVSPLQESNAVTQYPIAVILESGNANEYLDNQSNFRHYIYEVWIVSKVDNAVLQTKYDELRQIVDEVVDALDVEGNSSLPIGGAAQFFDPIPSNFTTSQRGENEVILEATVIVNARIAHPLNAC